MMKIRSRIRTSHAGLEQLEPRAMLDAAFPFETYFPEGFASASIDESVPIQNPSGQSVQYELHARYEVGDRDQLLAQGTLAPFEKAEHVLSSSSAAALVRTGVPYALVLKATAPVQGMLRHHDFGNDLMEDFSGDRRTEWSFGESRRGDDYFDFVLLFNPNDTPVNATLTMYGDNGVVTTASFHMEAQRRGGWAIRDLPNVPAGLYAAKVSADGPIVASQSQYHTRSRNGFGQLGTPGPGATSGFVPAIELERDFFTRLNDDNATDMPGLRRNLSVSVLNSSSAASQVSLTFVFEDNTIPAVSKSVSVPAGTRRTIGLTDLAIPVGAEFGILYRASQPVTVSAGVIQAQSMLGVEASTRAATTWTFAQGQMNATQLARGLREDIFLFNPTAGEVTVTVDLVSSSGTLATLTKRVGSLRLEDVKFRDIAAIASRTDNSPLLIVVHAPTPIVASHEIRDHFNNLDFSILGVSSGTVVNLSDILTPT